MCNTWHADAGELSDAVQAGGVILARHGQALVYVDLAPRASVTPAALALEGALGVHALSKMLARVGACGWVRGDKKEKEKKSQGINLEKQYTTFTGVITLLIYCCDFILKFIGKILLLKLKSEGSHEKVHGYIL